MSFVVCSGIVYAVLLDKHAYQTTNGRRGSAQILGFRIYSMEKFSSFFVNFLPDLDDVSNWSTSS